jgi:hypothetical protein
MSALVVLFFIAVLAIVVTPFATSLWNADFSNDEVTIAKSYEGEARVGHRSSTQVGFSPLMAGSGFRPLEIRGGFVRIGTSSGIDRLVEASLGLTHRLEASRFEVAREWIDRPFLSFVRPSGEGIVLRGTNHRGRHQEFTLLPRDGDIERLFNALERAGARAGTPGGSS